MITKSLNKREELAIDTLKSCGYFRKALETGSRGREQFETRLRDANGQVVKGVGYATWSKFNDMHILALRPMGDAGRGSTWPTEWKLA